MSSRTGKKMYHVGRDGKVRECLAQTPERCRASRLIEGHFTSFHMAELAVSEALSRKYGASYTLPSKGLLSPGRMVEISKMTSYALRHHPEDLGITVDEKGWTSVDSLASALKVTREEFLEVVLNDSKGRFSVVEDRVKCYSGHSIPVSLDLEECEFDVLFHGTKEKFLASILREGLKPGGREMVHLGDNESIARLVASRRKGSSVLLKVDSKSFVEEGGKLYRSGSAILASSVPPKFLTVVDRF